MKAKFQRLTYIWCIADEERSYIEQVKSDELPTLEYIATEKLLNSIASGRVDSKCLACLPPLLHTLLAEKITRTGIACPAITMSLVNQ